MAKNKFDISKKINALKRLKRTLPIAIANDMVNFSLDAFRKQGWTNVKLEKWAPRRGGDNGRALLVKSGALRRSIRPKAVSFSKVEIGSSLSYALEHNIGSKGQIKRQFIGASYVLLLRIKHKINQAVKKALNA